MGEYHDVYTDVKYLVKTWLYKLFKYFVSITHDVVAELFSLELCLLQLSVASASLSNCCVTFVAHEL